jgi:hypothetical protein
VGGVTVAEARAMSGRMEELLTSCTETRDLIADSRKRLADLRQQVDAFRRQCSSRYRPLCDTVGTTGLDAVLSVDTVRYEANCSAHSFRSPCLRSYNPRVSAASASTSYSQDLGSNLHKHLERYSTRKVLM